MESLDSVVKKHGEVDLVVSAYSMEMVSISDKLCKMLDYDSKELVGQSVRKIALVNDEILLNVLSSVGEQKQISQKLLKKNGEKIVSTGTMDTVMYKGEPYMIIKILSGKECKLSDSETAAEVDKPADNPDSAQNALWLPLS